MPNVEVRTADFHADYAAIRRVRFTVFVDEQNVDESLEMDDRDARCMHVLACMDGDAVATGRIDLEGHGKVGRVAVLAAARRRGVGTAVMQSLHAIAEDHGLRAVWCHAQVSAMPFYERLGYHATGSRFFEAGIEHVRMEKRLK